MRMVRNVAMAMVVLASATVANADSFVWFETANTNGNGAGGPGGLSGQPLNLTCDTSAAGSCSWVITGRLSHSAGLLGFNYSLAANLPGAGQGASANNGTYGAGATYGNLPSGGIGGANALLLSNHEGQAGSSPAANTLTTVTFTLTRTYTAGSLEDTIISATIPASDNGVEWFNASTGGYESVKFGGNVGFTNSANYPIGGGVVINVDAVPEPGSLGLLGMGALALLRRRR